MMLFRCILIIAVVFTYSKVPNNITLWVISVILVTFADLVGCSMILEIFNLHFLIALNITKKN